MPTPAVSIPCAFDVGNLVRGGDDGNGGQIERHVLSITAQRMLKPGSAPFESVVYIVTDPSAGWLAITETDLLAFQAS